MYIYGDESGSFALSSSRGAWCAVACYVLSESQRAKADTVLRRFKVRAGARHHDEVKRKIATEATYFQFLKELRPVGGFAVAVATDSGANGSAAAHQVAQLAKLRSGLDAASDEQHRELEALMADISTLSAQLYVEYICRLNLSWRTIRLATLFFARRLPVSLGRFRWVFDEKPMSLAALYTTSIPGFIRELAKDEPLEVLADGEYRYLTRFLVPAFGQERGQAIAMPPVDERIYDVARIMTEEVSFVDSREHAGVQIADLIVSGIRGVLRGNFTDNARAARLLGALLFDKVSSPSALPLISFADDSHSDVTVDATATAAALTMAGAARRLR